MKKLPPHIISRGDEKACSECKEILRVEEGKSLSKAFTEHVRKEHPAKPAKKGN